MGFRSLWHREPRESREPQTHARRRWTSLDEPYSVERRPTFAQWLKLTWLDILTIAAVAIVSNLVYRARPVVTRMFPLTVRETGEVVWPQFAYPYRPQVFPPWMDAFLAAAIPIVVVLLAQIRVRSFWDANNAIIGLIYALLASSCFQVFVKWLVGGLRPHFYDVCKPDPALALQQQASFNTNGLNGVGYQGYMYTPEVCTGSQRGVGNALESFPSGHATTIFAGMVFLYLYLNAKLKVFSNYHPAMWKLVILYLPILFACLVAGTLTIDYSHNWYDIIAGAIIGIIFALSAYRMVYAAIWDYRMNHIPLNRGSPFVWSEGCEGSDMVFTDKAGWKDGSLREQGQLPSYNGEINGSSFLNGRAGAREANSGGDDMV